MAAKTTGSVKAFARHPKVRRPGVHSKSRHSNLKTSKHYKKAYRGQGK